MTITDDERWFVISTYCRLVVERVEKFALVYRKAVETGDTELAQRAHACIAEAVETVGESTRSIEQIVTELSDTIGG